jgi:hypothetical protein
MKCPNREGMEKCTWWITGCVNPCVSAAIKRACDGQTPRYESQDAECKFYSYPPPIRETAFDLPKTDNNKYLRGQR